MMRVHGGLGVREPNELGAGKDTLCASRAWGLAGRGVLQPASEKRPFEI